MEDLEEWEVLPEDGFLEIHDDGGKKIFSRKYSIAPPEAVFKTYFSPKFVETTETSRVPNQLVPVPIQLEPPVQRPQDDRVSKEVVKPDPIEIIRSPQIVTGEADQDLVSQVFFKKMKETVKDMKLDSPISSNNRGIKPQIDPGAFEFVEKAETFKSGEAMETTKICSPRQKVDREDELIKKNDDMDPADVKKEVTDSGGLNILKWSLTGIGAICSFGVVTVCICVFGGLGKNKQQKQNQKLQFHIYTEDKQVAHHANKLNEAISRGVPVGRAAQITVGGGYYDGL